MAKDKNKTSSELEGKRLVGKNLSFDASEAYKLLRANILFSMSDTKKCKLIGITSAIKGEGKSTTAVNLAYELAEAKKKVLLVEADLRLPGVLKLLKVKKRIGLSHIIAGVSTLDQAIAKSVLLDDLDILPAGKLPPNPSEMLSSDIMKDVITECSEYYDYIIFDLPPVLAVSDSLVLAPYLSGMVVVVRQNFCDQKALAEAMRQMEFHNVKVLGFVFNNASIKTRIYNKKYKKNKYNYNYGYSSAKAKEED